MQIVYLIKILLSRIYKELSRFNDKGFLGGAVVENLPANAGDTGLSPGMGRFPHAAEQLGP